MKTRATPPASSSFRAFVLTQFRLTFFLVVSLMAASHGANTFVNTGAMATARTASSATLLPNGKVLVAGGQAVGNPVASAELYDPATGAWTATGSLATARYYQTATMLPNGRVLVAGGQGSGGSLASAELYDPATGLWTATGPLAAARNGHTATLLANGMVLVAGGNNGSGSSLASAELYDFTTGTWTATGPLATARQSHTATLLPDGKVLVAAGGDFGPLASAELYNPASGTWSATGSLATARYLHTATLLPNGKVLVAGGEDFSYLASAQLYDPATGNWTNTGAFTTPRSRHTASLLPNGKVIIAGGFNGSTITSAQIYDPTVGTWSVTGSLVTGRYNHTATLLPSGTMLIAGSAGTAELYDSAVGTWNATGGLAIARRDHTATLLPNGKVLVAGGYYYDGTDHYLASAELYDPASGTWSTTGPPATARQNHTATLLPNGKVLVSGGLGASGTLASAELYNPSSGTWSATGNLFEARLGHTATLLPSGDVLVVWGETQYGPVAPFISSAEIYDPVAGFWSMANPPDPAVVSGGGRKSHMATLLATGKVLVTGGIISFPDLTISSRCRLYDPATGVWTGAAAFSARADHIATLLPSGKVIVAGGFNGSPLTSAQIYDPVANTWSGTGSLASARVEHTAALLPNGKVLVAGGEGSGGALASTELYDPATGIWSTTGALASARTDHTATMLPSSKVLVAGGQNAGNPIASAELYDVGLGYLSSWQPQTSLASFDPNGRLLLTGTGFRGISSASGGNGSQDSPTNHPVVQLRRLANEQSGFLLPDPAATVSATGLTSVPVAPFSGSALVTIFANGIPSAASVVVFPDLVVEQTIGTSIPDDGTKNFGPLLVGSPVSLTFTIKNPNSFDLTGLTITRDGANAADFTVTASPTAPVPPGGSTTFTIQFASTTSGTKTAAIHIANNVAGKNPYDINLTGQAYSLTTDADGDGLNDASEFKMATLGFDWQVSQPALVNTLFSNLDCALPNLNAAGFYAAEQIQALNAGAGFLQRNPATGQFRLEIGLEKATDLTNFAPFPFVAPQTSINVSGNVEFEFSAPDNAAFFLLTGLRNPTTNPPGLVSWWRAENNATDSAGAHHGTLQNGAAFAPGHVGQAFSFNGANQYVLIGDPVPPSLQIQNEITLSAWIYVTAYPASGTLGLIVGSQHDGQQAGATIFLDGRTNPDSQPAPPGHIHFQIGNGTFHTANANAQVPLNQWVHIAATRKANEDAKIYYNGVLQPSASVPWSGTISYAGAWFAIGQQKDLDRPFNGQIDEARVYDRALTPVEVEALVSGQGP